MLKRFLLLLASLGALQAQQTVAPTQEPVGPARGENTGNYNVTNSFETGYRWSLVNGNLGMYRSNVNYGNGLRVLGSSLTVNSKEGHGAWFDEIVLNTIGLGNDPYQAATLRVQKNKLYRYDMMWRLDEYYNPALTVSAGEHLLDTRRRLQDHELTLFPQSSIHVDLGYSRNSQTGPGLSPVQEFDNRSNAFPVFTNVRREWNEYRLGATANVAGFTLLVRHTWEYFKDDTNYSLNTPVASNIPGDTTVLQQFARSEPYHGSNPGWLGNLFTTRKRWAMNARMTYVSGSRDFAMNETALGITRLGGNANRQILLNGNAQRPVLAGDFSISLFPTQELTVVNNTAVRNTRIEGQSYFTQFDNGTGQATVLNFNFLGVRTVANSTDINYRVRNWLGFYAGYDFSDREIRLEEAFAIPSLPGTTGSNLYEQSSRMNVGRLGIRIRPVKPLTFNLDGEVGHASRPLTPISDRNYHTLGGRIQYRTRHVQAATEYRQIYNVNAPLSLSSFSSHSRNYSAWASWGPKDWFSFDASYTKLHLDTLGGIRFFAGVNLPQFQTKYDSLYVSNIHAANLAVHFAVLKRADLLVGYSITKDVGDGRATAVPAGITDPVQQVLSSVQTFPLTYQTPLARLSVRISPKLRWNAGWQFYGYGEQFHLFGYQQNYDAHTGFTSLSWSF